MIDCIITYQKRNGDIFCRGTKSTYCKRIGDETAMGWIVLDIHYLYNGNYYNYNDYSRLVNGKSIKPKKDKKIIKYIIYKLNKLV